MPAQAGLRERRARSLGGSPLTLHHPFPGALLSSSEAVTAVSVSPPNRVTVAYDQILRETLFSLVSHIRALTHPSGHTARLVPEATFHLPGLLGRRVGL